MKIQNHLPSSPSVFLLIFQLPPSQAFPRLSRRARRARAWNKRGVREEGDGNERRAQAGNYGKEKERNS